MKILHVSHQYFPSIGGNQYHNQLMSEKLAELNEEAHVFTSHTLHMEEFSSPNPTLRNLPLKEIINGVRVRRFRINYKLLSLAHQKKTPVQ